MASEEFHRNRPHDPDEIRERAVEDSHGLADSRPSGSTRSFDDA